MKRFLSTLAVVAVAVFPTAAGAAVFGSGPEYTVGAGQRVDSNLYATGGTVSVGSTVQGDALVAGGTVSLTGRVAGDVAAVAGTLQLLGPVSGDVRAVGGTLTINDRVSGDVMVAGGTVHLLPDAVIEGDVYIAGGTLMIDGVVNGSVWVHAGTLTINGRVNGSVHARVQESFTLGQSAAIRGNLSYRAPKEVVMTSGAVVTGTTQYEPSRQGHGMQPSPKAVFWAVLGAITAAQMLMFLGAAALVVWRARRWALGVFQDAYDGFWSHTGRGVAWVILIPILTILLLVSFVGTFVGASLGLLYVLGLIAVKVLAGMWFGSWFQALWNGHKTLSVTWGNALGGVIAFRLIGLIPVVGWIAQALITLALFGVLVERTRKHLLATH